MAATRHFSGNSVLLSKLPGLQNLAAFKFGGTSAGNTVDEPKEVTAIFSSFYLADNGVTILCPVAEVGESGTVEEITYTKREKADITPENAETTCTSSITDMRELFVGASTFNADITHWDVSSVTNMSFMFQGGSSFNQDISNWDVSNVTNMRNMFSGAEVFNGDLGSWEVSGVTNMFHMFYGAESFNQDIGEWDVSSVTGMHEMFTSAASFNQYTGGWDVSNVTSIVCTVCLLTLAPSTRI